MPTNQQRRAAERQRLQKQLEQRREKAVARQRFTLIASIVGTLVVIGAIVAIVLVTVGGGSSKKPAAGNISAPASTGASTPQTTAPSSTAAVKVPTVPVPAADRTVSFDGFTVTSGSTLSTAPKVTGKGTATLTKVAVKDVVVGKGAPASETSTVTVQYVGLIYKTGKVFQSSWTLGGASPFSLAQTVKGFASGIGGGSGIAPMKAGSRRIIVIPSALGYGSQAQSGIPANSDLVFVVDLQAVS